MKNINELLKEIGIDIPADKQDAFNKAFCENYKTIAEHQQKIGKIEAERDGYKSQLDSANEAIKKFDGVDVESFKNQIADYRTKAEEAERNANAKLAERDFNDALEKELGTVKFTSEAAKNAVMAQIREAGLKASDGKILGLSDLLDGIRTKDAGAFVSEENPPARFTGRMGGGAEKTYTTKEDIMKIKDRRERQAAIANNPELFGL